MKTKHPIGLTRLMLTWEDCPRDLAMNMPRRLMTDYPTHRYAISFGSSSRSEASHE